MMTVLPLRSSSPKATSASYVAMMTSASRAALRANAWLTGPGARSSACTGPGSWRIGHSPTLAYEPTTGTDPTRSIRSMRSGSDVVMLSVNSWMTWAALVWSSSPRMMTRALLKYPGRSFWTCRIAHSCRTSRSR